MTNIIGGVGVKSFKLFLIEGDYNRTYNFYKKDIKKEIFDKIITSDPTTKVERGFVGKYSKWLLDRYIKKELNIEDLYKAKEYLELFNKVMNRLPINKRDINKYKNLPELYKEIESYGNYKSKGERKEEILKGKNNIEKVYEDSEWLCIIPNDRDSAIYWGKGTQWCTAVDNENNLYDEYKKKGNLYIIINKKDEDIKYQIQLESEEYRDARDKSVSLSDLPENVIHAIFKKNGYNIFDFMYNKEFNFVEWAIEEDGIDIETTNAKGYSLLLYSILHKLDIFHYLVERGADINRGCLVEITSELSKYITPFELAMLVGRPDKFLKLMVEKGVDPNGVTEKGYSYLQQLIGYNKVEMFKVLVRAGADINFISKDGYSVLMTAIDLERDEIVKFLVDNGVDIGYMRNGIDAIEFAKKRGFENIINILTNGRRLL